MDSLRLARDVLASLLGVIVVSILINFRCTHDHPPVRIERLPKVAR